MESLAPDGVYVRPNRGGSLVLAHPNEIEESHAVARLDVHAPEVAAPTAPHTPAPPATIKSLEERVKREGGMVLFHGGLPGEAGIANIDVNRLGAQQNKRGRDYGGFYLTDQSSRAWSEKYAKSRNDVLHGFMISKDARVDDRSTQTIDRLTAADRAETAKNYDIIKGKDTLGRVQYALLNPDVVVGEASMKLDGHLASDGIPIHKNDIVNVDQHGVTTRGRVAEIQEMGKNYPPVILVDALDTAQRLEVSPADITHTETSFPVGPSAATPGVGPHVPGIPESLTNASWLDVVNDRVPGYTTEGNQSSGINPSYWLTDKSTGTRFLFKLNGESETDKTMGENEQHAHSVLTAMGFDGVSPVATSAVDPNITIMQHAGDANGTRVLGSIGSLIEDTPGGFMGFMSSKKLLSDLNLADQGDIVKMTFMDAVLGNGDRHEENWLIGERPDGKRVIHPIDHGLLEPEVYAGSSYFQEFDHNAHVRLSAYLMSKMDSSQFQSLVLSVLKARDSAAGGKKTPEELVAEARSLIAGLKRV